MARWRWPGPRAASAGTAATARRRATCSGFDRFAGHRPQLRATSYSLTRSSAQAVAQRRSELFANLSMKLRAVLLSLPLLTALPAIAGSASCPATAPALGAPVRGSAPLLPADNWWNLDVRAAPADPNSAAYIAFINNGGTRRLHPDFGGEASPGSVEVYGMPYAVVDAAQAKSMVSFQY